MRASDIDGPALYPPLGATLTACPFCSSGCGLYLHHGDGTLTGVSPSEHHPVSQGRLCARGWGAHEAPLWGRRLLAPSLGESGSRRVVDWPEALGRAGEAIRSLTAAGGRMGVLASGRVTSEEAFLAVKLARACIRTPHVDSTLRAPYQAILSGIRPEGGPLELGRIPESLEESDLIVLLEENLAESHPRVASLLLGAVRKGARLITLAPARTHLSDLAIRHLALDGAGDSSPPPGLGSALAALSGIREVTLVAAPHSRDPARIQKTVQEVFRALENWGGEWGPPIRVLPLPIRANTRGAYEMGLGPALLPGARSLDDLPARARIGDAWGAEVEFAPGLDAEAMVRELDGLVLIREDLHSTLASQREWLRALESLKCLVVLDAYTSPATERATVALPLGDILETQGTLISADGRIQEWHPVCPPPGLARDGWKALALLMGALGFQDPHESLSRVREEMSRVTPESAPRKAGEPEGTWGTRLGSVPVPKDGASRSAEATGEMPPPGAESRFHLALVGAFDWGDDLLVEVSPTLRRDGATRRKLFPGGFLLMNRLDAEGLGVREGWKIRVRSHRGETEIPVSLSPGVPEGTLLAPFVFREHVSAVLGEGTETPVELARS